MMYFFKLTLRNVTTYLVSLKYLKSGIIWLVRHNDSHMKWSSHNGESVAPKQPFRYIKIDSNDGGEGRKHGPKNITDV